MIVHIVSASSQRTLCGERRTVIEEIPDVPVCRRCVTALLTMVPNNPAPIINRAVAA